MVAGHPEIDAIVYLGLGIQSNQALLMREGRFYPGDGLERIVDYHERQDARFAEAAAEISDATGKPILTATELAVTVAAQRGTPGRPRERSALLRVVEPRGDRARPSLPLRRVPPPTRPRLGRGPGPECRHAGNLVRRILVARPRDRRGRRDRDRPHRPGRRDRTDRPRPSAPRCGRCAAHPQPVTDAVGAQHLSTRAPTSSRAETLRASIVTDDRRARSPTSTAPRPSRRPAR